MITVTVFCLIALLLTYSDSKRVIDWGLKCGFIITAVLAAVHYDFGNDYMPYYQNYKNLYAIDFSINDIGRKGIVRNDEYGWGVFNMLFFGFGKYGFFFLVATISIIENLVYYSFIKRYVPRDYWWIAMFIYLFSTSIYLMNFSLLRQGFVASIFVAMLPWILKKKIVRCAIVTMILSTVHTSAIVLFPLLFLGYLPSQKSGKFYAICVVVIFLLFWVSSSILEAIFSKLGHVDQFNMYSAQYTSGSSSTVKLGLGFAANMLPLAVYIYYLYNNRLDPAKLSIVLLSSICYILIPMSMFYGQILGRISYYFSPFVIPAIPITYSAIKDKTIRTCLLLLFLFYTAYNYSIFFSNPTWKEHFSVFHTIFDASL